MRAFFVLPKLLSYNTTLWKTKQGKPGARQYQLARCAGREPEGRVYSLVTIAEIIFSLILRLGAGNVLDVETADLDELATKLLLVFVGLVPLVITDFIYGIRVWGGMIEVYGVRKRWMLLCLIPYTTWIPALIWGFNPKYQPAWKVEDMRAEMARLAFYGSIQDAREFFQRDTMEQIVKSVNRKEEGGDGLADEYVMKYAEVQHG